MINSTLRSSSIYNYCFLIFLSILPVISICIIFISEWYEYYDSVIDCYIYFVFAFFLLILILLKNNFIINKSIRITDIDIIIFTWVFYKIFSHFIKDNSYNDLVTRNIFIIPYYFCVKFFLEKNKKNLNTIFYSIALLGVLESCICILQIYNFIPSKNTNFTFTGSLFNPGPLSISLSISVLSYFIIYHLTDKKNIKIILIFFIIVALSLIIMSSSRTSWISLIICLLYIYKEKINLKNVYNKNKLLFFIISIFTIIIGLWLIYFKLDSAIGRLHIWYISLIMWGDNPMTGMGILGFERNFSEYLMTYLENIRSTDAEIILGKVQYSFNEYLQVLVEEGILGLFFLLLISFYFFRQNIFNKNSLVESIYKSIILLLLVSSLFSYPLRVFPIHVLFITFLAIASSRSTVRFEISISIAPVLLTSGMLISLILINFNTSKAKYLSYMAFQKYQKGQYIDAEIIYKSVLPYLDYDKKMMMPYAKTLFYNKKYSESLKITTKIKKNHQDTFLHIIRGDNYKMLANFSKAKKEYYLAIKMDPKLVYPKYILAKLYSDNGEKYEAEKLAKEILNMPIKINSAAIRQMQTEMLKLISSQ